MQECIYIHILLPVDNYWEDSMSVHPVNTLKKNNRMIQTDKKGREKEMQSCTT